MNTGTQFAAGGINPLPVDRSGGSAAGDMPPDPLSLLTDPSASGSMQAAGSGLPEIDATSMGFGGVIDQLSPQYGEKAVTDAIGQLFKSSLNEKMIALLQHEGEALGLSPVEVDAILSQLRQDAGTAGVNGASDVSQAVAAEAGDEIDDLTTMIVDGWRDQMLDESKRTMNGSGGYSQGAAGSGAATPQGAGAGGGEGVGGEGMGSGGEGAGGVESAGDAPAGAESAAAGGEPAAGESGGTEAASEAATSGKASESGGAGGTSGSDTNNWLVVLASILGKASGKHLKAMVDLGEQMGAIDSKADPEKFAQLNAEFQAEAQIFKLFQEAISTMIKSIGEGMSTVARKM